jgi:hypothetical protein
MSLGEGRYSARIIDPFYLWNEECWRFESRDGKVDVSRIAMADCELTIQGLTAPINGAHILQGMPHHKWDNPGKALQSIQRDMFPKMIPICTKYFDHNNL